jgi:hypothetical protein
LNDGGDAEERKKMNQNLNHKKNMKLLNMAKTIQMNGKKEMHMNVLVNPDQDEHEEVNMNENVNLGRNLTTK